MMTTSQIGPATVMIIRGTDFFSGDLKEKHYLPTDIMDIPIAKQTKYQFVSGILQYPCISFGG